jgi:transglutaminase-like putative cysteine protease
MYRNGRGVTRDDTAAVAWFRKAAERGNAFGQVNLGYMYQEGRGVPKDDTEAATWYRKSAEQGNIGGEHNLGLMYRDGRGIGQNHSEAARWLRKAAEQGDTRAKAILTSLEEQVPERAVLSGMVAPPVTASPAPQCPAPAAGAYEPPVTILRNDRSYDVHADGTYTLEAFTSICLNNDAGVKEGSQAPLNYNVSLQDMEVLEAYTTTRGGKRVDVAADRIILQQSPASADAPTFGDARSKTVIFPATEIGAVLTLRWRLIQKTPLFRGNFSMNEPFPLTKDIQASQVILRAPESLKVHIEAIGIDGGEGSSDKPGTKLWRWTMQNAAVHAPERGSTNAFDFSPRIVATTFAGYEAAGNAYLDRAAPKAAVTPATQKLADEITLGIADRRVQAEALYQWVSKSVRYVALDLGSGGVTPHEAEAIAEARYGDCKDHVTLLEALLAAKGIKSSPVLVNASDIYSLPKVASFPGVFDHVITYLPEFDLFVDSTVGVAPFGVLPAEERGKLALVTGYGKGVSKIVTLPLTDARHDSVRVDTQLSINADGAIVGSSKIVNAGVFDLYVRQQAIKVTKGTEPQAASSVLIQTGQNGTGTYILGDPRDLSSAFTYSTEFTLPDQFRLPGPGALAVPVGLGSLTGIYSAFEQMDSPQRDFPVAMVGGHREEVTVLTLPRSIKVTALPKPEVHGNALGRYESSYTRKGNVITIKRILDVNLPTPTVGPDDYQKLRAVAAVVRRDLRAQIVYQ